MTKEMTRELFFSVPVFHYNIEEHKEINKKLKKIILDWKEKQEGLQVSNVLGWHSNYVESAISFAPEKINFFTNIIDELQKKICEVEEYKFDLKITSLWAMVNKKYAYNTQHTHPGCHWAGVYYVQCPPKCGSLVFKIGEPRQSYPQPIYKKQSHELQQHQFTTLRIQPEEGQVVMFPSWLQHEVEPNLSDEDRISISFNLAQEVK